jgi:hypothetical protein
MDFQQAHQQFAIIDQQFRAGKISDDQYKAALIELRVTDSSGSIWQIQERTGAWYVFWQGQWVAKNPPGFAPAPPVTAPAPQPGVPASGAYPQLFPAAPRKKSSPWKTVGIAGGLVLLVVVLSLGMIYLLKPGIFTAASSGSTAAAPSQQAVPTETQVPQTTFSPAEPIPATAGGAPATDANGVTLQVPAGAAEDPAQLTAVTASGELVQQLQAFYQVDTPFYQVAVQGQKDGSSAAELSFPAPGPDSRLMLLIDQQYPVLLDVLPQDGKLTVQAHLGPSDSGIQPGAPGGSIYYAVVTPKGTSSIPPVAEVSSRGAKAQAPEGKTCAPPTVGSLFTLQRCESNQAGAIKVAYPTRTDLTHFNIDAAIASFEAALAKEPYSKLNGSKFTAAAPMIMVVSESVNEPKYNAGNGVIYVPLDVVTNLGANNTDLWHEMGHLIESKTYSMYVAGNSSPKTWWLEVATENLVMLASSDYIKGNIDKYGSATNLSSPTFIFQSSPYQWPCEGFFGSGIGQRGTCGDYYIQAQLLKVNICPNAACPLSEDSFLAALNQGVFPFNDSANQDKVTANLEDYARYLLGLAPVKANSTIPLTGVQSQEKYGQHLTITQTTKGLFNFTEEATPPQITVWTASSGINGRDINAALDKDGVYPLQITSGSGGKYTALPAALVIEPGAPFYYRLDGGELKESDGSKEVTIAPIHATLGIGSVRIVAYSKNGGESFKAHIQPVDLTGAWVIVPGKQISTDVVCTGDATVDSESHNASVGLAGATYFGLFSAMGQMQPDATGLSLDWNAVPSRLPPEFSADKFQFQSTALIGPNDIKLQGALDIPNTATSQRKPLPLDPTGLAVAALLPAAGLRRRVRGKMGRRLALALAFILLALALAGCVGMNIYGSFNADLKITGLEYKGGKGTAAWTVGSEINGDPIWTFTKGTGTYPVKLTFEFSEEDDKGNTKTSLDTCSGTAVFELTGYIFEDITITIPKTGSSN